MKIVNKVLVEYENIEGTEIYCPNGAGEFTDSELEMFAKLYKHETVFIVKNYDRYAVWFDLGDFLNDYCEPEEFVVETIEGIKAYIVEIINRNLPGRLARSYIDDLVKITTAKEIEELLIELESDDMYMGEIEVINEMAIRKLR